MALIAQLKSAPKTLIGSSALIVSGNPPLKAATHEQKVLAFGGGGSVTLVKQSATLSRVAFSFAHEHGVYKLYIPPGSGESDDCYYLPWAEGKAYAITLGAEASIFTTAHMSSCALYIGGTPQAPTVIHANVGNNASITGLNKQADTDNYTKMYNNLLQALVTDGTLAGNSTATPIAMHDPGVYMTGSRAGYTAVVGGLTGGSWAFYYNVNNGKTGFTGQLWPAYDKFPY